MPRRTKKLTDQDWLELVKFYHEDESHNYEKCALRFGVSMSTVAKWFREHPEVPRRAALHRSGPRKIRPPVKQNAPPQEVSPSPPEESSSSNNTTRVIVPLKE